MRPKARQHTGFFIFRWTMTIINSGTDRIEKPAFTHLHLRDTNESATAIRFMKAAVRIGATHGAILPLLRFVKRAFRRAVSIIDGIAGWERVLEAANCTNITTAAIILSNALSRIDTNIYPRVSLQLVHPLGFGRKAANLRSERDRV